MNNNAFKTWMKERYTRDELKQICQKGAFELSEFYAYSRTSRIYALYKEEIWEIVRIKAEKSGYEHLMAWFTTFTDVVFSEPATFECHLVWVAAKIVACQLLRQKFK